MPMTSMLPLTLVLALAGPALAEVEQLTTTTCVAAPPRVAGLARATIASSCGARDGVVHEGDSISLQALGHFRLEADLDTGNRLEVTCVGAAMPLVAVISGEQAPCSASTAT